MHDYCSRTCARKHAALGRQKPQPVQPQLTGVYITTSVVQLVAVCIYIAGSSLKVVTKHHMYIGSHESDFSSVYWQWKYLHVSSRAQRTKTGNYILDLLMASAFQCRYQGQGKLGQDRQRVGGIPYVYLPLGKH